MLIISFIKPYVQLEYICFPIKNSQHKLFSSFRKWTKRLKDWSLWSENVHEENIDLKAQKTHEDGILNLLCTRQCHLKADPSSFPQITLYKPFCPIISIKIAWTSLFTQIFKIKQAF
jgi:hypothetical protein